MKLRSTAASGPRPGRILALGAVVGLSAGAAARLRRNAGVRVYASTPYNPLLERLANAVDTESQVALEKEAAAILRRDLPLTYLHASVGFLAAHERVRGIESPYLVDPLMDVRRLRLEDQPAETAAP